MNKTLKTLGIVAVLASTLGGCSTTVGPVVAAVAPTEGGGLKVRKCEYRVTVVLGIVGGGQTDCEVVDIEPVSRGMPPEEPSAEDDDGDASDDDA